jgi:hypothetical protein
VSVAIDGIAVHLAGLEAVWEGGMEESYARYRVHASPPVALAAAMVEAALELQSLGREAPAPGRLLLGDLCLARASRLLAETRDMRLQVGFARAVERAAAAAAGGPAAQPLTDLLLATITAAR